VRLFRDLAALPNEMLRGDVAVGNFDGVHVGHAQLVSRLVAAARRVESAAVVLTFDPPPMRILRPEHSPPPLTWTERKAALLHELGVDAVVAYPTDRQLLKLSAEEFFENIVVRHLEARAMVEGPNFAFGRDRRGDVALLAKLTESRNISLEVVDPAESDGAMVSSSRVRQLLKDGRVDDANAMLTRPYRMRGVVERGAGRGTGIGFPTANLTSIDTLVPGEGVYAGRAYCEGTRWPAAINVGPNPTFGEAALKVEAHLLGFTGALYDRPLEIELLDRLRDVRPFAGVEELVAQLHQDVDNAARAAADYEERHERNQGEATSPPIRDA